MDVRILLTVFLVLLIVTLVVNLVVGATISDKIDGTHFTISACLVSTPFNHVFGTVMLLVTAPWILTATWLTYYDKQRKGKDKIPFTGETESDKKMSLAIVVMAFLTAVFFALIPAVSVQIHPNTHMLIAGVMFFLIGLWMTLITMREKANTSMYRKKTRIALNVLYWVLFLVLAITSSRSSSFANTNPPQKAVSLLVSLTEYSVVSVILAYIGCLVTGGWSDMTMPKSNKSHGD